MKVWRLLIRVTEESPWKTRTKWVLAGFMASEHHEIVERRLSQLAKQHNTAARAVLEETR